MNAIFACFVGPLFVCAMAGANDKSGQDGVEFFEAKIRPVLVEHCQKCHSQSAEATNQLKGNLKIDSRAGLLRGGDSGPALELGKPEESLLIEALRYESLKMPPKGKLPDSVIADFVKWIAMGAPDPRAEIAPTPKPAANWEAKRNHWCYQPLKKSDVSQVKIQNTSWSYSDVDRWILSSLEQKGLTPAPDADRTVLIRRLTFDLTGLPPTPEEIDAFLKDSHPQAYERLVDRLLASPRFGERFGRHWLDVARYAESLTLRGFLLHSAWRYRDYVVDSFNQDRPYDQFLREQIAGDLLPAPTLEDRRRQLVATSYLAIGNTNLEEQDKEQLRMDVVDEQLDVVSKGILAQTLTCARCHDHKFDPIPTRDYYAMAGIFRNTKSLEHANVSKWMEVALPVDSEQEKLLKKHENAIAALKNQIDAAKKILAAKSKKTKPTAKESAIVLAKELPGVVVDDVRAQKVGEWKPSQFSGRFIDQGYVHDLNQAKGEKTLTFLPELPKAGVYEVRLAYSPGASRSQTAPVTVFSADGEKTIIVNQRQSPPIDGRFLSLGEFRFELNGQGFVIVSNKDAQGHVTADAVQFLPVDSGVEASNSAKPMTEESEVKRLEAELKALTESGPKRPTTITVFEEAEIQDARIHIRGLATNLGEIAPRGFMQAVSASMSRTPSQTFSQKESGRRELADWLTRPDHPLTARVWANRIWHWLMGSGLVRTTDNFGTTGELPSHSELLDHLATSFVQNRWSTKALVRQIVLSRTYQQTSLDRKEAQGKTLDPENRLFWRSNRKRLEAECLTDALLSVSSQLDLTMGGSSLKSNVEVDFGYVHDSKRRAIYWPMLRNSPPDLFELFDGADSNVVMGRRNVSTVAPQALFFRNHPFVIDQARLTAKRLLNENHPDDRSRLTRLYRLALSREPRAEEIRLGLAYLNRSLKADNQMKTKVDAWTLVVQAVFASLDFRYCS